MSLHRRRFLHHTAGLASLLAVEHLSFGEDPKPKDKSLSPFLEGNFGPVKEEITVDRLEVVGKLPKELNGMFVRNGPNPQFAPLKGYHWFDGDGMLHGVHLRDGKASYRNRYVQTEGWNAERKAGKALWGSLMEPPDLKKMISGKPFKNTANTALILHHGKLLALWEGGEPHEIKVPELETVGIYNFGGKLKHAFTAHPKVDPTTGEMMFFGYAPFEPYVQYSVADAKGVIQRTTPIDIPRPIMMHDFAITQKYSIFMDLPETFSFERVQKGQPMLKFEPDLGARFGIIPRHGKKDDVKWFASPPCFVFHTLNAYDDGDEVVLLACRMKEYPSALDIGVQDKKPADAQPLLYRWRFNMKTGKVREESLDDRASEFPRINDTFTGKHTRFGYTMKDEMNGSIKYDLEKGTNEHHAHAKGCKGGEGVFVSRPDPKSEDDGWLLTFVHDENAGKSEMVVVDARDFHSPPTARVILPGRVPYGFHGTWIPLG